MQTKKISIVIPMKNESCGVSILFERLVPVLNRLPVDYELVVINDGSSDNTLELLIEEQYSIPQLKIVDLSRNFGKEAALYAGFENSTGDCAVSIDADLQHPPELIQEMVSYWLEGYEIVVAVRETRDADTYIKKITSGAFYKVINRLSETKIIPNSGDFRLLDRKAIDAFLMLDERVRFNKGIFSWIGFREKVILHPLADRAAGETQWNYLKLIKFSIDGITSFSKAPLEIWTYAGAVIFSISFLSTIYYLVKTLIFGKTANGYASLFIIALFFGGVQLISIGILGKYIGRVFLEVKKRPIYIARNIYRQKEVK